MMSKIRVERVLAPHVRHLGYGLPLELLVSGAVHQEYSVERPVLEQPRGPERREPVLYDLSPYPLPVLRVGRVREQVLLGHLVEVLRERAAQPRRQVCVHVVVYRDVEPSLPGLLDKSQGLLGPAPRAVLGAVVRYLYPDPAPLAYQDGLLDGLGDRLPLSPDVDVYMPPYLATTLHSSMISSVLPKQLGG